MPHYAYDLVGAGVLCMDYVGLAPHLPGADENVRLTSFLRQQGGTSATAIATAARLGLRTAFVGATGLDDHGRFLERELERHGVDTGALALAEDYDDPTLALVLVDATNGKRSICFHAGSLPQVEYGDDAFHAVERGAILHVDSGGPPAMRELVEHAHAKGSTVSLDVNSVHEWFPPVLDRITLRIASRKAALKLCDTTDPAAAAQALYVAGGVGLVTLGDEGCVGVADEGTFFVPAFAVNVVDTTGAGDVFHGAFLAAWRRGQPAREAAQFAAAAAAISCTALGNSTATLTTECVNELLQTRPAQQES